MKDLALFLLLLVVFPYAYVLCCVYGFCTAPRWRLAPVVHWKDFNEVTE